MTTFPERLKSLHTQTSDRVALTLQFSNTDDLSLTVDQLLRGASSYARALTLANIQPGEVVVLILQHGEDLAYAFWGTILHGAIPSIMPFLTEKLSPERYRADLSALISVTQPAAIITYPEFEAEARGALQEGDSVREVIVTDKVEKNVGLDFDSLVGFQRKPEDIVILQHSSGTTGLQKGVALSHRAIFNQLDAYSKALKLNENDVVISWLPLYHDMGLIAGFIMPILSGIHLVLQSPFDWVRAPYKLMNAVTKYRGTLSWLPNFAYNFCAQKIRDRHLEGVDLSTWRAITNCSEPVRWESHNAFYEKFKNYGLKREALQTSYAMAENVFAVTQSPLGGEPAVLELDREAFMSERVAKPVSESNPTNSSMKMMSSGRPLENVNVKVLNESRNEVADRVVGEVALKSDCMLTGYYHREDATQQAFLDGWYLTGDYGFISDGEVFVSGRKKDMIIVGGKNVYPQDLESLSYEVAGVHAGRSVAFGIFDEEQGTEDVVIIAEVDTEDPAEQQKVADAIRLHVTKNSAIALRYVKVVDPKWILKTSSGKTARSANKEKFLKELN
ncbi:MAG TPA: AMP-binding protein [Anaerolineales bacterium]|nr:AMP-binding protein [Anaerolineales bacterium]HNQ93679.1 AMP-binding protein [Anaerolineales bacterium]HNS60431.1 AMP-binding protein [Anaerolineales bacterium]